MESDKKDEFPNDGRKKEIIKLGIQTKNVNLK